MDWNSALALDANAKPNRSVIEFSFTGAILATIKGWDIYGRSLTVNRPKTGVLRL